MLLEIILELEMNFNKLIFIFILVPVIELFLLLQIGKYIGVVSTVIVIIVTGVMGAYLVKNQGLLILFKIKNQTNEGIIPTDNLIEGLLVLIGGIFLLTPGFITDIAGFIIVLPETRKIIFIYIKKFIIKKFEENNNHFSSYY